MKVLVLRGSAPTRVSTIVREGGDEALDCEFPIDADFVRSNGIGFIVSHGYRHIIRPPVLQALPDKAVNLHISLLPWNRGADPNLWSFLEDTPKGVTLHHIDEGLDTGDVIAQREVFFRNPAETLASTYRSLQEEMIGLFEERWAQVKAGRAPRRPQPSGGSSHRSKDKEPYTYLLLRQWDTPVSLLRGKANP